MNIRFEKAAALKPKPDVSKVKFGSVYSDYMFMMDWTVEDGWQDPRIVPFDDLHLNPAALVFHYALEVFEGLKAYRTPDGKVQMFRVDENGKRMANSAERMSLPRLPEDMFVEAVEALVSVEKDWVPDQPGTSLYVRPVLMAVNPDLALHGPNHCLFFIICSPVGSYYAGGLQCNSIRVEEQDVRAVRGGTGFAKCGGNYACAQRAANKAVEDGYNDVLWLDGVERRFVEEVGGMNIMFKKGKTVMTPQIATGSVLPGITRKSIIDLLKEDGYTVEEKKIDIDEIAELLDKGEIDEVWGCGTAAVISPVGKLCIHGKDHVINNFETGPLARKLYETLTGIQWGTISDTHNWIFPIQ